MPPTVEKDREITEARALLGLRPGMTYCELGAASHHMTALGKAVMPGGHVVVTAPNQYQLDDLTRAAKDADAHDPLEDDRLAALELVDFKNAQAKAEL